MYPDMLECEILHRHFTGWMQPEYLYPVTVGEVDDIDIACGEIGHHGTAALCGYSKDIGEIYPKHTVLYHDILRNLRTPLPASSGDALR